MRGKDWPTISATVDLVDVVAQNDGPRGETSSYLATLTYIYRNPELQMGDYSRKLGDKDEAQAWANSYKGSRVIVHVNTGRLVVPDRLSKLCLTSSRKSQRSK